MNTKSQVLLAKSTTSQNPEFGCRVGAQSNFRHKHYVNDKKNHIHVDWQLIMICIAYVCKCDYATLYSGTNRRIFWSKIFKILLRAKIILAEAKESLSSRN